MKKLSLAIAALGFVASSANAAVKTQYFYQANTDQNVAQAQLAYDNMSTKTSAGTKNEASGVMALNLNYERGLNDMFAVGIMVPWQFAGKSKSTPTAGAGTSVDYNGMGDISIYGKGTWALADNQNLHFGLGLDWSMSDAKSSTTKVEPQDGRMAVVPYVGYVYNMGNFTLGAKLAFNLALNSAKLDSGTGTKTDFKGGDSTKVAVFGEMPFTSGLAGLEIAYRAINQHKTTAFPSGAGDGINWLDFNLYGTYEINEMWTIIPEIGYSTAQTKSPTYDSGSDMRIKVAGRYTF